MIDETFSHPYIWKFSKYVSHFSFGTLFQSVNFFWDTRYSKSVRMLPIKKGSQMTGRVIVFRSFFSLFSLSPSRLNLFFFFFFSPNFPPDIQSLLAANKFHSESDSQFGGAIFEWRRSKYVHYFNILSESSAHLSLSLTTCIIICFMFRIL